MKRERIKRLHWIQTMISILQHTRKPQGITWLVRKINLKHISMKPLLKFLLDKNLIRQTSLNKFQITEDGLEILHHYYFLKKLYVEWELFNDFGEQIYNKSRMKGN